MASFAAAAARQQRAKAKDARAGLLAWPRSPMAIALHAPNAVRSQDKPIGLGGSRVAENLGVVDRIDPDQAARDHIPALAASVVAVGRRCWCGTENAEHSGDCNHDQNLVSSHGILLPVVADYLIWLRR